MATLKDTLVLGKLTVVDKIVKSGGLPTSILTGDGSMASVGSRTDSTATTGNSGQIYLVQRNAAGQLVVDVPWSAGSGDVVATSVAAGGGIDVTAGTSSYTVSHKDTSTATSVDGAIVNKITIDGYGHITALGTTTIDLGSYVSGSELDRNTIILGDGSSAIKTSGKQFSTMVGADDTTIPTSKAVQDYVMGFEYTSNKGTVTGSSLTDNQIIIGTGGVGIEASGKTISTSVGADDTTIPTSKAVKTWVEAKGYLTSVSWDDLTSKPTIPTIPTDNVTGSGTNGKIPKFTGTNTIGNGYAVGTSSDYTQTPAANRDSTLLTQAAIQAYITGLGYTTNTGDITGVTAGNGLTGGATSGNATLNVGAGTGITVTADAVSLATISGLTAGSYGPSSNQSLNHLDSFSVPYVTVDTYGRVTGISTKTLTLPSGNSGGSGYDDTVHDFNEATGVMTIYSGDAATTGVTAGGYGQVSSVTLTSGSSFTVPYITVNEGGRVMTARNTNVYLDNFATQAWVTENFQAKCLLEGTKISMADGTQKNIEEIRSGDLIKSINIETGEETQAVVLHIQMRDVKNEMTQLVFEDGSVLKTNGTHDIYDATKDTWVLSDWDLDLDDEILKEDGSRIKFIGTYDWVGAAKGRYYHFYDIITSNNCYYADGILCAHNPIRQFTWLNPVMNKYANYIPAELKEIISSYKDENARENDLLDNEKYMKESVNLFIKQRKKEKQLGTIKSQLAETDYITIKSSEGVSITPKMQQMINSRAKWREEFNTIEKELQEVYTETNKLKFKYSSLQEEVLLPRIDLRRKFFKESCKNANEHLQDFIEFYRDKQLWR